MNKNLQCRRVESLSILFFNPHGLTLRKLLSNNSAFPLPFLKKCLPRKGFQEIGSVITLSLISFSSCHFMFEFYRDFFFQGEQMPCVQTECQRFKRVEFNLLCS